VPEQVFLNCVEQDLHWVEDVKKRLETAGIPYYVQPAQFDYHVDGQSVATFTPVHFQDWNQAPLGLIIYSLSEQNKIGGEKTATRYEMDEVIVGGFKSQ
jgi:hypothetical protein